MSNPLSISKEKVLEAASKCPDASRTLKILFPEAFVEIKPKYVPLVVPTVVEPDGVRHKKIVVSGLPYVSISTYIESGGVMGLFLSTPPEGYQWALEVPWKGTDSRVLTIKKVD